jgi:TetR/AcrR family transcriptional repressor of nem operon
MANPAISTKQKLIETALELLWTHSYGSVSVDDICKAADVKKGSFYHFFPSKAHLAIATMEEASLSSKPFYDEIFSPTKDPTTRFEDFADYMFEKQTKVAGKYGHVCGCPCASLSSEMAGQEEGIRAKFEEISRRQEGYFENALRDAVAQGLLPANTNVKNKAREISTYLLGQLMLARIENDLKNLKKNLKPGLMQMLGLKPKIQHVA